MDKHAKKHAPRGLHAKEGLLSKKPAWMIMLSILLTLIMVFAVGVIAYGAWFMRQLDDRLVLSEGDAKTSEAALASHVVGEPFYVLLLGSDSRAGTSIKKDQSADGVYSQRADVIMLVRVDAAGRQITMVSVPRDTRYVYPDGTVAKINDAYNSGSIATVQAVSELTDVPISYYAAVDFASFEAIIDLLGGITVDVPADIQYKDALTGEMLYLEAGTQVLDGQHAQLFARARKEYGEDVRQSNNRQMIEAMIKAVFDRPAADIPETILGAASYLSTNMRSSDLIETGLEFAFSSGELTFYSCTGPTDGDFDSAYGGTWYCYDNPEGWAKLMAVVDAGEDPSGIEVDDTAIIHS